MFTKSRALVAVGAAVASLGVVGCGSDGDGGGGDEIVIGASGPLTGPASALGVLFQGMESYIDDVNDAGGIEGKRIRLVVKDDQFNPASTPGIARSLVEGDKIALMCGTAGSATSASIKDYLDARGIGHIPAAGSSELISKHGYLTVPSYAPLAGQMAQFAVEKLKAKRIAILYSDDAVGEPTLLGAEQVLKELGVTPVAKLKFSATAPDQSAVASKLVAAKPDFVIVNHQAPVVATQIKAAARLGFRPTWGAFWPAQNRSLARLAGGALTDNLYMSTPFVDGTAPEAESFRASVGKHFPKADTSDVMVMLGWTTADVCVQALKKAAKAAGGVPNAEQVAAALPDLKHDDEYVRGLDWSGGNQSGLQQAKILRLKDGSFETVEDYGPLPKVDEDGPETR